MADQKLEVWASQLTTDGLTNSQQRRNLELEESLDGWLRLSSVTAQQLNQLNYLLTASASPQIGAPFLWNTSVSLPDDVLEFDGQTITADDAPNVADHWGTILPDWTAEAPTGSTYVVRKV